MPLRILVADDHEVVRRGLRALLQARPGWEVCGEAASGREAVERARELRPDIAILDITMPELNGLEAARRILRVAPRTQVLILTMHDSDELVQEVLATGARGYVLKSDAGRDLVAAVEALAEGRPFFTARVADLVLSGYLRGSAAPARREPPARRLTGREREVLQLLAEGRTNKEVAALLAISVKTVETHRANIMRKLNLHSISELVHYAIRNRMINA
jgi:DNA-binding NarL/FixJ family response regulator